MRTHLNRNMNSFSMVPTVKFEVLPGLSNELHPEL